MNLKVNIRLWILDKKKLKTDKYVAENRNKKLQKLEMA